MAPLPLKVKNAPAPSSRLTRSKVYVTKDVSIKRKADSSPTKDVKTKRSALGDLAINANVMANKLSDKNKLLNQNASKQIVKKVTVKAKQLPALKTVTKLKNNENLAPPPAPFVKIKARQPIKTEISTAIKPKDPSKDGQKEANGAKVKRLSNEFEKTEESLYTTALEDSSNSIFSSAKKDSQSLSATETADSSSVSFVASQLEKRLNLGNHEVPEGVVDFDKENWNDELQASHYAMDIFNYLKEREKKTKIPDYMERQVSLTTWMRALLIDWMVEIQESFELNHETLYLAVKLVDMYLSKVTVSKENLQLVGSAAMFVASKFDERIPPYIDDFLYICDGAYSRDQLIYMEMNILKVCDFQLGISISYRFLRRYARCAKVSMVVLTLARYILETSLMNYNCITIPDSILAAAALYLALKMKNIGGWTPTLEFYSGYKLEDILETAILLNKDLHVKELKPRVNLKTIYNKYSHKVFFEVAKTPLIKNECLTA